MKIRKHRGDKSFDITFQTRTFSGAKKVRYSQTRTETVVGHDEGSVKRAFLFGRDVTNTFISSITVHA